MDHRYPEFETAVGQFREFLAAQGWPSGVVWVAPGQVVMRRRRLIIRESPAEPAARRAESVYAVAAARRLGVCLEAICRVGDRTYARAARPATDDAASRLMFPDGLKLSVPVNDLSGEVVSGSWRWWRMTRRAHQWPDDHGDIEA